jgi:hypothetical protein
MDAKKTLLIYNFEPNNNEINYEGRLTEEKGLEQPGNTN